MRTFVRWLGLVWCLSVVMVSGCGKSEELKSPTAKAQSAVQLKDQSQESIAAKLANMGVDVQVKSKDEFFITKGFPYQKDIKANDIIEIVKIDDGIFTASEKSSVPTKMMGMVNLVAGGSFIPKCNAKDGTHSVADSIGNTWIFREANMEFSVYLPGATNPVFTVRSTTNGATIKFTEEGVLLKGFILKPFGEK
jgi:hypothetical protein